MEGKELHIHWYSWNRNFPTDFCLCLKWKYKYTITCLLLLPLKVMQLFGHPESSESINRNCIISHKIPNNKPLITNMYLQAMESGA